MFLCIDCLQNAKCYKWEKGSIDSATGNAYIPVRIYGALSINPALVIVPSYDGRESNITEAMYMNFTDGLTCYSNALFQLFGDNGIMNKLTNLGVGAMTTFANPNFDMLGLTHYKGGTYAETAMDRFEGDSGNWQSGTAIKRRGTNETFGKDLLAQKRAENDIVMKTGQSLIDMSQFHMVTTRVRGSGGNYDKITGHQEIYFKSMTIKEEFARKIDKFFDMQPPLKFIEELKTPIFTKKPEGFGKRKIKSGEISAHGCYLDFDFPDKKGLLETSVTDFERFISLFEIDGSSRHLSYNYLENTNKADELIKSNLFRPPHGWMRWGQYIVLKHRYTIVMWDLVTRDYSKRLNGRQVLRKVKKYVRNGSIITFHDSIKAEKNMKYALPRAIEWLKEQGYEFKVFD